MIFHLNNDNNLIPKWCVPYNNKWKYFFLPSRRGAIMWRGSRKRKVRNTWWKLRGWFANAHRNMINLDQTHWTFKFILHMYDGDDSEPIWIITFRLNSLMGKVFSGLIWNFNLQSKLIRKRCENALLSDRQTLRAFDEPKMCCDSLDHKKNREWGERRF